MLVLHGWKAAAAGVSIVALTWLVTCSSASAQDGDSCSADKDCKSGRCGSAGSCEGSDCTCADSACHSQASCRSGWLCTRTNATTFDAIPQCRQQCGDAAGACPSSMHCENAICVDGPTPFSLTWANIPRSSPCAPKVPCDYKITPPSIPVDMYTWQFGDSDAGGVLTTTEPNNTFTYDQSGSYDVVVHAHATTGAVAELTTTEVLCNGSIGDGCDAAGAPCCQGSCGVTSKCQ